MASDTTTAPESLKDWKPQKREWLIMITLALLSLMAALDATILVPILPTLAHDLHGTFTDAFWAGTAYLLTSAVFQPFIAAVSDALGPRELLFLSLLLFIAGSTICATAQNFTILLAGRSVQGINGGGIITLVQFVFASIIPLRQRPKWFSLILAAWALGTITGPLVGGVFAQMASFRWVFWINLPFCVSGLVLVPYVIKATVIKTSLKHRLLRIDWIGGFLFISSITSLLIGLSWAGVQFAWTSYQTLVPIILGLIGVAATLLWELFGAYEPFLQRTLFHKWSLVAAYTCTFIQGLILFCIIYYIPFYFASVFLKSPIASGVDLLPLSCFILPGSIAVSQIITRLGLLILLGEKTEIIVWVAISLVFGIGNGMVLSAVNFGIQSIVRTEDASRAASIYAFMRSLGIAVGVAVSRTAFQNVIAYKVKELGLSENIAREAEGFIAVLKTLAESDPVRLKATQAYVYGFKGVFVMLTGISSMGLFASCFIKKHGVGDVLDLNYEL